MLPAVDHDASRPDRHLYNAGFVQHGEGDHGRSPDTAYQPHVGEIVGPSVSKILSNIFALGRIVDKYLPCNDTMRKDKRDLQGPH